MSDREQYEAADWISGDSETVVSLAKVYMETAFRRAMEAEGVVLGDIVWQIKKPGDDRVPDPPDNIEDPHLLYGAADVLYRKPIVAKAEAGMINDLEPEDLERMRVATRRAHRSVYPGAADLSDTQCDSIINRQGPETVEKLIRSGTVH